MIYQLVIESERIKPLRIELRCARDMNDPDQTFTGLYIICAKLNLGQINLLYVNKEIRAEFLARVFRKIKFELDCDRSVWELNGQFHSYDGWKRALPKVPVRLDALYNSDWPIECISAVGLRRLFEHTRLSFTSRLRLGNEGLQGLDLELLMKHALLSCRECHLIVDGDQEDFKTSSSNAIDWLETTLHHVELWRRQLLKPRIRGEIERQRILLPPKARGYGSEDSDDPADLDRSGDEGDDTELETALHPKSRDLGDEK